MPKNSISSKFAFIGENLDLKKNVNLEIDSHGRIVSISFDEPEDDIILNNNENHFLMVPGLMLGCHAHL